MIGPLRKAWLRTGLRLPIAAYAALVSTLISIWALKAVLDYFRADEEFSVFAFILNGLVSIGMGAWRGCGNHPASDSKYRQWLKATPWSWRRPLPLGPAWAGWEDALIIAFLTLLWKWPFASPLWPGIPALFFMACATITATVIFLMIGWKNIACLAAFALGGLVYLTPTRDWNLILALAAAFYLLANWGLMRSMREFPWETESAAVGEEAGHYRFLSGKDPGEKRFFLFSVPLGWTLGWLAFVAVHTALAFKVDVESGILELGGLFYMLFSIGCAVACLNQYFDHKAAPLGRWARIVNGYRSFPRYDRIVTTCLLALIVSVALPFVLLALKVPREIIAGACVALQITFYALAPSPRRFSLTGEYQLVLDKPSPSESYVQEIKPNTSGQLKGRFVNLSAAVNKQFVVLTQPGVNASRRRGKIEATVWKVLPRPGGLWVTIGLFGAIAAFTTVVPGIGALIVAMFVVGYGGYRVANFHPAFHPQYRRWLTTGPWSPQKPLPFGPVEPVWQDLIAIAVLSVWMLYLYAMGRIIDPDVKVPAQYLVYIVPGVCLICSAGYALKAMSLLCMIGRPDVCCLMLMLMGVPLLRPGIVSATLVMIAAALIAGRQLRDSLNDMPWAGSLWAIRESRPRFRLVNYILLDRASLGSAIGPRQHYLAPKLDLIVPGARTKILLSALIGWWAFLPARLLIVTLNPTRPRQFGILFEGFTVIFMAFVMFLMLGRIACYYLWGGMPMSGFGRLFTLRWIIWRYDKPALISVAIAAGSIALPFALNATGLPLHFTFGISFAAATALALMVGPSIRTWLLTGGHREPGKMSKTLFARFSS